MWRSANRLLLSSSANRISFFRCFASTQCQQIPVIYESKTIESKWVEYWKKNVNLTPHPESKNVFSMILPPPNVTGHLHLGHALTVAIEDSMIRYHRMQDLNVNWIPGMDHAGIATQALFDKELQRNGENRYEIGRELYTDMLMEWSQKNKNRIKEQLQSMGSLLNWKEEYYTLDTKHQIGVRKAFVHLFQKGEIYRGQKMLHYCPTLRSVLSDIEVDWVDITSKQKMKLPSGVETEVGVIYDIKYPIRGREQSIDTEYILISTTRPETIFGDVGIAIHSSDRHHGQYLSEMAINPLTNQPIPLFVDDELVKVEGEVMNAVKVTPYHDFDDYECGLRHQLPGKVVISENGTMTKECGVYAGQDRFIVRKKVVEELKRKGLLLREREHPMRIPTCSRTGDILEPTLLSQWFFKTEDPSAKVLTALENHPPVPASALPSLAMYLKQPKDWCLSRQLWWGHRVPAYRLIPSQSYGAAQVIPQPSEAFNQHCVTKDGIWVIANSMEEAKAYVTNQLQLHPGTFQLNQDEDVLDTWFSSGLVPLLTNPTSQISVMETGIDILFFWVCRMSWLSEALCNRFPFKDISLHSMVVDPNGKKMSKSRGNVIDPLDIIYGQTLDNLIKTVKNRKELSKKEVDVSVASFRKQYPKGIRPYGNDVLRFTLISEANKTVGIKMNPIKLEYGRYVSNKLWNLFRFYINYSSDIETPIPVIDPSMQSITPIEQYMMNKAELIARTIEKSMDALDVENSCQTAVNFLLTTVCDFYVEYCKPRLKDATADEKKHILSVFRYVLESVIAQLHPFLPFETEEINSHLEPDFTSILHKNYFSSSSPLRISTVNHDLIKEVEDHMKVVHSIRGLHKLIGDLRKSKTPGENLMKCVLLLNDQAKEPSLDMQDMMKRLTHLDIEVAHSLPDYSQIHMPSQLPGISVLFPVPEERKTGVIEQIQANMRGIEKKLKQSEQKLEGIRKNLKNPMFLSRASKEVIERERNDEVIVVDNCRVLHKNLKELNDLIHNNSSLVC